VARVCGRPDPGRWDKFRAHLFQIICSSNVDHFEYLLKLLAYTIQFPGERSQVAMVMRGEIGAGKGTLIRMLEEIFGHHFIQLDKVDQLVGRFNAAISGKVIVFADEAFWAGDKREVGALKRLITEPTLAIEFKNIDIVSQRNCVHLFMATNEDWSVPAGLRERRFFAVEVSSARMQDHTYFNDIYDEMRHGGVNAFLHDMLHLPVTADDIRRVPMTKELRAQQNLSLPLELQWWCECLSEAKIGQLVWTEWVPCATIYEAYKTWAREHTNRFLNKIIFGQRMAKFFSVEKTRAKRLNGDIERCWRMRDLDDARHIFDTTLGTTNEWPDAGLPVSQGNVPF
jgi:phage/plasmid-associated DNA primase